MIPLLRTVKNKTVLNKGIFFIFFGTAYIIRKKIKSIISMIFIVIFFACFSENVYDTRTFSIYDTHGRVCMKNPVKIRVDIYFFG